MKTLRWGIFCAVLAALAVLLVDGARSNDRLRTAIAALRPAPGAIDELRAENRRLAAAAPRRGEVVRAEHEELVRLRAQLSAWRGQLDELAKPAAAAAPRGPSNELRRGATAPPWQNKGRGTAAAAFETGNWAQWHGDVDAMLETFVFEAAAQAKLNALFAAQPGTDRTHYGTPERMAAMLAMDATAGQTGTWSPMQIVEHPQDADNADVTLKVHVPGGADRERTLPARRFPDGWKMVLPMEQVDMLENALSSFPPTQRMMAGR
jgi:hypothetical protein